MPQSKKILLLIILTICSLLINSLLFFGPIFLISAPVFFVLAIGFFIRKKTVYAQFCIGFLLEYGLVCAGLEYLEASSKISMLIPFLIGITGISFVVLSLWQLIFDIKVLPKLAKRLVYFLSIVSSLFILCFIAIIYLGVFYPPALKFFTR